MRRWEKQYEMLVRHRKELWDEIDVSFYVINFMELGRLRVKQEREWDKLLAKLEEER